MSVIRGIREGLTKSTILRICVLICFLNIVLVLTLAGAGVLKSAESGDVTYTRVEPTPYGDFTIPQESGDRFVIERPTDVDAFYDAVVRIRNGGPLLNPWGGAQTIQRYHYHPIVIYLFYPLYFLGYFGFKVAWLLLSVLFTVAGTYILLIAEEQRWQLGLSRQRAMVLAIGAVGFAPMVTNYKSGQTTPLMYLSVAVAWWYFRRTEDTRGGVALIVPMLIKPYLISPLVVFFKRDRVMGVVGFLGTFVVANLLGVAAFGPETIIQYYEILVHTGLQEGGTTFSNDSFEDWFSNSLKMFWWFGDYSLLVRLLFAVPLAIATVAYFLEWRSVPASMYAYSIVMVMLLISGASVVDLAMILVAVIVLGYRLYAVSDADRSFSVLGASFILFHIHPYFMEFFVGAGPTYLNLLASYEQFIITVVPFLQPAMYGIFMMVGLLLSSLIGRPNWFCQGSNSTPPAND